MSMRVGVVQDDKAHGISSITLMEGLPRTLVLDGSPALHRPVLHAVSPPPCTPLVATLRRRGLCTQR